MLILLVCAGGMSSSILALKMNEQLQALRKQDKVEAITITNLKHYIEDAKIICFAPQIEQFYEKISSKYPDKKMFIIDSMCYGMLDAQAVLQEVYKRLEEE